MSDFAFILAAVVALVCAGYLLVRYEILDVRDAAAGAGLIGAVAVMWRMMTKKAPNGTQTTPKQDPAPEPIPPTRDVERVIAESDQALTGDPSDDVHEKLRARLRDRD